jgi:hypothetical protein
MLGEHGQLWRANLRPFSSLRATSEIASGSAGGGAHDNEDPRGIDGTIAALGDLVYPLEPPARSVTAAPRRGDLQEPDASCARE